MKCIRGIKNKAPQGSYLLQVSLLGRLGGCVLQWWQMEKLKTRTHPARHDGNFYDVGLYFHESLYVVSWFFCTHITFYLASPLSLSICLFIPIHTAFDIQICVSKHFHSFNKYPISTHMYQALDRGPCMDTQSPVYNGNAILIYQEHIFMDSWYSPSPFQDLHVRDH